MTVNLIIHNFSGLKKKHVKWIIYIYNTRKCILWLNYYMVGEKVIIIIKKKKLVILIR